MRTASSGRGCGALPSPAARAGCNCRHAASGTRSDAFPCGVPSSFPGPALTGNTMQPLPQLCVWALCLCRQGPIASPLSRNLQAGGNSQVPGCKCSLCRQEDRPVHSSCLQRLHVQQALLASSPCAVFLKAANGQASRAAAGQAWTASESCLPFSAGRKRSKFVSHIPDCCSAGKHLDESDLQSGDKHLAHVWLLLLL